MILVRAPLRITLGGGGTDLPSYASQRGGYCLSAAIDKYVYVSVLRPFEPGFYLKYSQIEKCKDVNEIKHPVIRETLKMLRPWAGDQIEITALADIPSGTGLGSSGAFTVALIKAITQLSNATMLTDRLAELAFTVEAFRLGEPVGRQDPYASAWGGVAQFVFEKDGAVKTLGLLAAQNMRDALEENLMLFFTGYERKAGEILADQQSRTLAGEYSMMANLDEVKDIGQRTAAALELGDEGEFIRLLNAQWFIKDRRQDTPEPIRSARSLAMKNAALACKLVGAGGGGFLLCYTEDKRTLRSAMVGAGLREVKFKLDFEGVKVL
jgi:D-glycero-alpha-D-manno-heptose-7-phosphate kinase